MKPIISNDFQIGINKAKYIHDKYNIYFDLQNLLKQIYEDNRIKIKYVNQNNTPITKYDSINNYYVILLNYNSSVALNNFNIAIYVKSLKQVAMNLCSVLALWPGILS